MTMDAAGVDSALSPPIRRLAASAHEIVVCLTGEVLAPAYAIRAETGQQALCMALCPSPFPAADALRLLKCGYHLYEANVSLRACAFFERRAGFYLPEWEPIPDACSQACRAMWSRTAALSRIEGHVAAIEGEAGTLRILRLAENPYLRLTVSGGQALPAIGQRVTILGRADLLVGMDVLLLECLAICDNDPD
jgi:hypothetical protein